MFSSLGKEEILEIKNFMKILSTKSAEIIKSYHGSNVKVDLKFDESPVTKADIESEKMIKKLILDKYPDHSVLGEEDGFTSLGKDNTKFKWVIDPIDGTKSFITGAFDFGTCIALLENDKPIIGMISQPITGDILIGDGDTTEQNGEIIKVTDVKSIEECTLLLTDLFNVGQFQNPLGYSILSKKVQRTRTWGNCFGYTLLAQGYPVIMVDPIMAPWDLMALIPIIRGAGGTITDYQGNDPVSGNSIVACAKDIHSEVISILNNQFASQGCPLYADIEIKLQNNLDYWQYSINEFVMSHKQKMSAQMRILDITSELAELIQEINILNSFSLKGIDLANLYQKFTDESGDLLYAFICLVNDLSIRLKRVFSEIQFSEETIYAKHKFLDDVNLNGTDLVSVQKSIKSFENKIRNDLSIKNKDSLAPNYKQEQLLVALGNISKAILKDTNYGKKEIPVNISNNLKQKIYQFFFALCTFANEFNINLDECLAQALNKYQSRFKIGKTFGSENIQATLFQHK